MELLFVVAKIIRSSGKKDSLLFHSNLFYTFVISLNPAVHMKTARLHMVCTSITPGPQELQSCSSAHKTLQVL